MIKLALIVTRPERMGPVILAESLAYQLQRRNDIRVDMYYLSRTGRNNLAPRVGAQQFNPFTFPFHEYDIIQTSGIKTDFIARIFRKRIKCWVSVVNSFIFDDLALSGHPLAGIYGKIWLCLWKKSDKLVCVSDSLKKFLSGLINSEKLYVIHNGVNESDNNPENDLEILNIVEDYRKRGLKVALTVGMLNRTKGLDQLLPLMPLAGNYALVIIGSGREKNNLLKLATRPDINGIIWFAGFRKFPFSTAELFDLYIAPSRTEGFGLALVEAVSKRMPVICSGIQAFRELFDDSEVTFFDPTSGDSFIRAVETIEQHGLQKAEKAFFFYKNRYTAELMAENYFSFYTAILQ